MQSSAADATDDAAASASETVAATIRGDTSTFVQ